MKGRETETRKIEELLGKKIVTAGGKSIGHIFDIQLSRDGEYRVIGLMFGRKSLLYRLHVYKPVARMFGLKRQPETIPWKAVEQVERSAVRLKADIDVSRFTP